MDHASRDDAALAKAWADGDASAFDTIVERHRSLVWARCRHALGAADADDAVQAVFLVLLRRARQAATCPCLVAWLLRVADHVVHNARRDRSRRVRAEAGVLPEAPIDGPHDIDVVVECLNALPLREREAIVLHHLGGRTLAEVATATGAPMSTVHERIRRGLERMRRRLAPMGAIAIVGCVSALAVEASVVARDALAQRRKTSSPVEKTPVGTPASLRAHRWAHGVGSARPATVMTAAFVAACAVIALALGSVRRSTVPSDGTIGAGGFANRPAPAAAMPLDAQATEAPAEEREASYTFLRIASGRRIAERIAALPEWPLLKTWIGDRIVPLRAVERVELVVRWYANPMPSGWTTPMSRLTLVGPGEIDALMAIGSAVLPESWVLRQDDWVWHPTRVVIPGDRMIVYATHDGTALASLPVEMPEIVDADQDIDLWNGRRMDPNTANRTAVVQCGDGTREPLAIQEHVAVNIADGIHVRGNWAVLYGRDADPLDEPIDPGPSVPVTWPTLVPSEAVLAAAQAWRRSSFGFSSDPAEQQAMNEQFLAQDAAISEEIDESSNRFEGQEEVWRYLMDFHLELSAGVRGWGHGRLGNAVLAVMARCDGWAVGWVRAVDGAPVIDVEAAVPRDVVERVAARFGYAWKSDGTMVIPTRGPAVTIGWRDGRLCATTDPRGLALVPCDRGFLIHPDAQVSAQAMPSAAAFALVVRPRAVLEAFTEPGAAVDVARYRDDLATRPPAPCFLSMSAGDRRSIEASGVAAAVAAVKVLEDRLPPFARQ